MYLHLSHLTSYIRARGLSFFSSKVEVDSFFQRKEKRSELEGGTDLFWIAIVSVVASASYLTDVDQVTFSASYNYYSDCDRAGLDWRTR